MKFMCIITSLIYHYTKDTLEYTEEEFLLQFVYILFVKSCGLILIAAFYTTTCKYGIPTYCINSAMSDSIVRRCDFDDCYRKNKFYLHPTVLSVIISHIRIPNHKLECLLHILLYEYVIKSMQHMSV